MESYEQVITPIINRWKEIIETLLLAVIQNSGGYLEGNIYNFGPDMTYTPEYYVKQQNIILCATNLNVKKVLEIGFNSGFSTLLMLLSNPNIHITCVDINIHPYTVPCYNIIKEYFGDRVNLIIGDSTLVVPTIKDTFDLIHIDGAHDTAIAEKDIINSIALCNDNCILIMDDTDMDDLNILWSKYSEEYNLSECPFNIFNTFKHSIKQYVKT
jgi:hypothetical protein